MYQIKNRIYPDFDKTQKSGVCNFLRALVKQNLSLTCSEIMDKFLEDEKYYLELNASRFPFLADYINEKSFLKDTEDYIKEQMSLVYDIIYNRVERSTFFVTELVSEALKLYDEDNRKGISVNLNELLLKSIDEKYLKLAKININNRKPKYDKMMKDTKRKAKMHQ